MQDSVPSAKSIWDMGLVLFKQHLLGSPLCLEKLLVDLLWVLERERQGIIEASHRDVFRMLFNLQLYASHFEPRFHEATKVFFGTAVFFSFF
jgi:hypothetical protein